MRPGLEATCDFRVPEAAWSQSTHCCFVEVDVETGAITIPRYLVVEDCGEIINPAIVDGQIRGGVAQGIAAVLYERHVYDDDGQLLTASFADYLVPAACDLPDVEIEHLHPEPLPPGEIPFRGVGEGGFLGAPGAVTNAVADALAPLGVQITEQYLPPLRVRQLIEQAGAAERFSGAAGARTGASVARTTKSISACFDSSAHLRRSASYTSEPRTADSRVAMACSSAESCGSKSSGAYGPCRAAPTSTAAARGSDSSTKTATTAAAATIVCSSW